MLAIPPLPGKPHDKFRPEQPKEEIAAAPPVAGRWILRGHQASKVKAVEPAVKPAMHLQIRRRKHRRRAHRDSIVIVVIVVAITAFIVNSSLACCSSPPPRSAPPPRGARANGTTTRARPLVSSDVVLFQPDLRCDAPYDAVHPPRPSDPGPAGVARSIDERRLVDREQGHRSEPEPVVVDRAHERHLDGAPAVVKEVRRVPELVARDFSRVRVAAIDAPVVGRELDQDALANVLLAAGHAPQGLDRKERLAPGRQAPLQNKDSGI